MDPIDDIFSAMRVHRAIHARIEATAPWGVNFVAGKAARFGLVIEGNCWLEVEGKSDPIPLGAGDCYVILRGTRYSLRDHPGSAVENCYHALRDYDENHVVHLGGGGKATTVVTGWFLYDAISARPLVELMPALIQTRMDAQRSQILQATLQLLALETQQKGLGSQIMISRLADILFIQTIRAHAAKAGAAAGGWLGALCDRRLGPVFRAIHEALDHDWTVDALAAVAGMSRSAFAAHFKEAVGSAPLEYLTHWRMFRAGHLLRKGEQSTAAIAFAVGYESESAFSKTFKRVTGVAPGAWRRTAGEAAQVKIEIDPRADGRPAVAA
ncbi:AraC family transcriptional regulator [Sphingomonas sp. LaA6.9]|uniref:AraC family transcriptional regulator n=1 Tax=Sphingomonas sp. LaA6.9 TaxID=2919914 RepID=UPI001F4F4053|nr:AraC family transcriptional regulator [Sphingomonas sp. LaA6.9]MCJ8155814.1 AraC family transcriptional regulator [Sphingomonas sp. LaA6.9]